ncbi:site-specific integrase [Dehalococcoidia bacterium]|nr:site-specific integrase [Dehalococcoidia bacterium]
MHRGKHGDQGSKVRSTAWFMLFLYLLPDKLPALGATNRMIVMFCYNRLYRRYLHLLPALITATDGNIRWDIYPAMSTHFGSTVYNFGGLKEKPSMPFGPFLLARSSPCRGSGRVLHRGRIAPFYLCLQPLHSPHEIEVILPLKRDHFFLWGLIGEHGQNELHTVDSKHQIHRDVNPSGEKQTSGTHWVNGYVLFEKAMASCYYPVIYTAVSTGLRQAELLGLRWRDIDLDMLSISVSQVLYKRRGVCQFKEPKTGHSRRRVSMMPKLALFLREYKAERELFYHKLGRQLTLDDLVFTSVEGRPIDPSVLTHAFARMARQAGMEGVRFHDLRHTFASLMLLRGAKPKVISEALGHSSVAFTMDTYSHIIEEMQSDAMALLDEVSPTHRI